MSNNKDIESLIPLVNKLQDTATLTGEGFDLDLPQIAVVGSQSAGKSSVLENFVGRDFLPRGSGIVTRRPLVLKLIQNLEEEYAEFLHCRGKIFHDFDKVQQEIVDETERTVPNKNISNKPINLTIYSPNVLNLTLVDLPGMTRVAVGDQPHDIGESIRAMILEYIGSENTLILAVTPANIDLANSDALNIAREVDPSGFRTIGVITKLDIMDQGTDARDTLDNKIIPLRRGYIGIVNRSQRDIDGKKDIRQAQAAEREFFLKHPAYRQIHNKHGTRHLQKTLSDQLTNHIRAGLPALKERVLKKFKLLEQEIRHFDDLGSNDPAKLTKVVAAHLNIISEKFNAAVDGRGNISGTELSSGARISSLLHERLSYEMNKININGRDMDNHIGYIIKNSLGIRSSIFSPTKAFEIISVDIIGQIHDPCLKIIDLVNEEMRSIFREILKPVERYPIMMEELSSLLIHELEQQDEKLKSSVKLMIDFQLGYLNTKHPEFIYQNDDEGNDSAEDENKKERESIIRKGYLITHNLQFRQKDMWFVLTNKKLTWYKDAEEREAKHTLLLHDIVQKSQEQTGFMSNKKSKIILYSKHGNYIYKELRHLELSVNASTNDDIEDWKAAFLCAGVSVEKLSTAEESKDRMSDTKDSKEDIHLSKQIFTIKKYVNSYMKITLKTHLDMIPKMVIYYFVNHNNKNLLEESDNERINREETIKFFNATKEALAIISQVSSSTSTTPLPPPVKTVPLKVGEDKFKPKNTDSLFPSDTSETNSFASFPNGIPPKPKVAPVRNAPPPGSKFNPFNSASNFGDSKTVGLPPPILPSRPNPKLPHRP